MSPHTLDELRADEVRYRRRGYFQAADNVRRLADETEIGNAYPFACQYLDRGGMVPVDGYLADGLALIRLDNGIAHALTPDRAKSVIRALIQWVEPDLFKADRKTNCPDCGGSGKEQYCSTWHWFGDVNFKSVTTQNCSRCAGTGEIYGGGK